jgi:hypothetical protein
MTWVIKRRSQTLSVACHRACKRHDYLCELLRLSSEGM